jgi:vacuolar protein sorting-associated protein 13B
MLEGYITPLLMSYISKYVKNIQPSDLKLSFWGGDAVLRNLELRLDVLERELQWPIEIKSGRIRELTLHIPWSAILSTPVEVAIKDIEFVIKLKDMRLRSSQNGSRPDAPQPAPRENPAAADAASSGAQSSGDGAGGGGQGYLSRISNNVIFHVQNLVIKVIEEECDLMLTLNIPAVEVFTADESWTRVFVYTDYFQGDYDLHGVWDIKDMIVNLQQIDSSGQVQDSSEPFVQRCSFSCRMKSTYRGGVYVHHATNVLWERIEFSCDENQFCLFLHLLDWLLAIYYQSKRLRGRDDKSKGTGDCEEVDKPSVVTTELSAGVHESLQSYVVIPEGQVGDPKVQKPPVASTSKPEGPPQDQGWGSWAWSFVSSPTSNDQSRSSTESGTATPAPDVVPSSSFAMFAKSASIDIKVTHQIQIPVFYSVKSFTRSILSVNFIGALFQLDRDPATQLFLVSMGAMSISADITGLCSCVQKPPSSWRAVTDQIPVFSFGEEDSTHDPNIVVRDSLFDESADQKPGQQQQQPAIPPPNPLELLDSREKVFTAGWLTYEYYDVGPSRETEECTVVVQFGRGEITLSPDVVHRLQHYYKAFSQSLEANPVFSEGMVVIGDPKAETIVKVRLASGRAVVTPNTHYIPASDTRHQSLKSSNKTPRRVASSKLPVLCFAIARSSVHITYPMYTGNASEETPQKYHLRAEICGVTGSDLDSQGIHFQEEDFANLEQFLHVPNLEVSHHSKTIGIEETQTSYLQLDVEEGSLALSLLRISKLLSITGSWRGESIPRSTLAQIPSTSTPTGGESGQGHLLLSVKNLTVTQSISEEFSLLSAVLGEGNGSLVKDTPDKQLLPFFHGPLDTQQWNTVCAFQELKSQPRSVSCSEERLVELFVATPHQKLKNERFPAFQLSISGFALSLDPSLLAFTKLVSLKSYHTPFGRELHLEEVGSPEAASGGIAGLQPGGLPLPYTATSPTPTCSTDVPVATHPSETKDSLMTTLKHYAAKIKINPVLLILPNETHIAAGATEDVISPIPVLPALAASLAHSQSSEGPSSNSPTAAVILCLPQVRLESAKSHVLDEPVPRNSRPDTLPWDCTLSQLSLFTIAGRRAHYLLEPATVKASLAAQQEGTGVTVHVDTLALSVSESQVGISVHASCCMCAHF